MFTPTLRFPRRLLPLLITGACAVGLAGCNTDMMTYSKDAEQAGLAQMNDGKYADAAGSFQNSVRQDPTNYKTRFYLAECAEQTQQYTLAIHSYKACLDLLPSTLAGQEDTTTHEQAMDNMARLLARVDENSAQTDLLLQEAEQSHSPDYFRVVARAFRYKSDADTALDVYHRALLVDEHNFDINKEYGLYLVRLGQTDKASQPLREAYRSNQSDAQVNAGLRQIGINPGPALMPAGPMANPVMPRGPGDSIGATDEAPIPHN